MMTLCAKRIATAGALLAALTGCAPSIDSVTVTPGEDVSVVSIEARVRDAALVDLETPTATFAVLPPGTSFSGSRNLANAGGPVYRIDSVAFTGGQYRVRVTVPYRVLFMPGTQTKTREVDFTINVPAGCFFFDQGLANWVADGYFGITSSGPQDDGTRVDICAGQTPLRVPANNFPAGFGTSPLPANFSSLGVALGAPCFSNPLPVPPGNQVVFDFVSPSLAAAPGWENAVGYELQARHEGGNFGPDTPPKVQLIFIDTDGQARPEVDAAGNRVFHDLPPQWQAMSVSRPGFRVDRIRTRVFVPVAQQIPDSRIAIDRVCPRNN